MTEIRTATELQL